MNHEEFGGRRRPLEVRALHHVGQIVHFERLAIRLGHFGHLFQHLHRKARQRRRAKLLAVDGARILVIAHDAPIRVVLPVHHHGVVGHVSVDLNRVSTCRDRCENALVREAATRKTASLLGKFSRIKKKASREESSARAAVAWCRPGPSSPCRRADSTLPSPASL